MKPTIHRPRVFFTSDTHDGHANIIKYSKRPFKNIVEMRYGLLENINSIVRPYDILYHQGDVAMGSNRNFWEFIEGIQCENIHLVFGNHDRKTHIIGKNEELQRFASLSKRIDTSFYYHDRVYSFTLTHHPLEENKLTDNRIYLNGHTHKKNPVVRKNQFDIGVDGHNLKPWSLEEIMELYLSLQ